MPAKNSLLPVKLLPLLLLMSTSVITLGQDLEKIGNSKPVTANGFLSSNAVINHSTIPSSYRSPFAYYLNGGVTLNVYGVSIPVTVSWSSQKFSYTQPFNRYALHPTYKWVTGHFGYTSVSYSPYSVNGHLFLGAAVDAKPGKWELSSFYGRFLKETAPDTLLRTPGSYERWGYGFKATLNEKLTSVTFSAFKAKDELSPLTDSLVAHQLLPQDNLAVAVGLSQKIVKGLSLKADWGGSAITSNLLAPEATEKGSGHIHLGNLFTPRTTSAYYQAYKTGLQYQHEVFSLGAGYERIDPGYRTLGAYSFNNDLENITVNGSVQMLDNRLSVAANTGFQHDNLDNSKASKLKRWVGSANVNYSPSQKLSVQGSYSNFYSFTNIRSAFVAINQTTPYPNLDTLTFTQLSQSVNLSATYNLGNTNGKIRNVMLSGNVQDAADKQGGNAQTNAGNRFYNSMATYIVALQEQQFSYSIAFNYSQTTSPLMDTHIFGPVGSINKTLLDKKLRINLSSAFNQSVSEGSTTSQIVTARLNNSLSVKQVHQFQLGIAFLNRSHTVNAPNSTDLTINVGYNYQFALK